MVADTLRVVRKAFSTSGQTLIYLSCVAGVLIAMFTGWGFVDGAFRAILISLLVAAPYLIALMAVQFLRSSRDVALTLLLVASLSSGVDAWMLASSISGLILWAATPVLFLGTVLVALGEMSFHRLPASG